MTLADVGKNLELIQLLNAAYVIVKLLIGRREMLPFGLVALEIHLRWT